MTEQQKQAFDERQRIAYQNQKTGINEAGASSSVQASNSAGSYKAVSRLIPRRSPRFIGRGNTAESLDQGPHISEEQLANDRERRRVRQRTRQKNMMEKRRSSNLFEHVMHEHVQAEITRLLCCVSRVAMNTSEEYMEYGPSTQR
ncbi:hypothetical protein MKW98_026780 [Papaver atlanticum]|uniref:Uncharacterized protein n=1 Tax=Papaver atlanticum TaxID=357466 RepID=A0AAD4S0D4_9MAGN|nr:hypothetical protein MKW98_026780 [Papaver atlanticum]